jgi:hypothetical protein
MPPDTRYATPRLRRAATRLLAHEAGGDPPTSEALAAAAGRLLDRLWQRLGEVIGPVGVQAIFLRTVTLLRPEFPFLDERIAFRERGASLSEPLRACLQEQKPDVIREVSVIVVATFTGLLATLIGERLAWNLLQQIWPDTLLPDADVQEIGE